MIGPEGVARSVAGRLRDKLPAKVVELRARYQAPAREFPDISPENIHPTERDVIGMGQFPAVLVSMLDNVSRTGSNRVTEATGEWDEYEYRYRVRVWLYVTGDDYGPTALARMRLLLGIREALISDRVLGRYGEDRVDLDHHSLRESFDEGLVADDAGKLLGVAAVEFEVKTTERYYYAPGIPVEVQVTVDQLPPIVPHPADLPHVVYP